MMGLDGSERDERIAQLLEGVFPAGEESEIAGGQKLCFLIGGPPETKTQMRFQ